MIKLSQPWVNPRKQHNLMGQYPDGSTILYFNHQMVALFYISFTRWQHNIIFQSPDGSTILYFNQQMAAQYHGSIPRWQHNIIFHSPDGSTILYFNQQVAAQSYGSISSTILYFSHQMAAQYYIWIVRWQYSFMGQSHSPDGSTMTWVNPPDGSTIFYFNHQMAAQYYISITRWQHNIMGQWVDLDGQFEKFRALFWKYKFVNHNIWIYKNIFQKVYFMQLDFHSVELFIMNLWWNDKLVLNHSMGCISKTAILLLWKLTLIFWKWEWLYN